MNTIIKEIFQKKLIMHNLCAWTIERQPQHESDGLKANRPNRLKKLRNELVKEDRLKKPTTESVKEDPLMKPTTEWAKEDRLEKPVGR